MFITLPYYFNDDDYFYVYYVIFIITSFSFIFTVRVHATNKKENKRTL